MAEMRLYQSVAKDILALIESGEFPPGSRLPGERELADRFGVSRVTIREAEIALETRGLISIRTGSGVFVLQQRPPEDDALSDVTALELTTARALVEGEAAALAAPNMTPALLAQLEATLGRMSDDSDGMGQKGEEADREFHLIIAGAAKNPVIEHFVRTLWRIRSESPKVKPVYASVCASGAKDRVDEHGAVLDALRKRDPAAARAAMREHFRRLFEALLSVTEQQAVDEVKRSIKESRARFLESTRL